MDYSWFVTSWSSILIVILKTIGIYTALIVYTRMAGLRSFSKMSSFDFAMTVAVGSLIASTILSKNPPLIQAMAALAMLYILQIAIARVRRISPVFSHTVDNEPLLIMDGPSVIDDNLHKAQMTYDDLRAKLREANVTQMSQVKAVVMETTGDVSVLHHENEDSPLDDLLLKDVRGYNA